MQDQVSAQLHAAPAAPASSIKVAIKAKPSADESKLNKLESAWLAVLRADITLAWVGVHALTFKIGDDCRYTPDFIALNLDGELITYETKGFMRDDARVKLKVAARMFPFVGFVLVERKAGAWICTEIKP
jgi:hypothetical protein